jgi:hypothetical protein
LQFIKTVKLLQFCKFIKFPSIGNFAIYKNDNIIVIVQIANYKNGQIIAILQIEIDKNGQIIAILQIIKNPLYREFCNL